MTKDTPAVRAARFANLDLIEVATEGGDGATLVELDHLADLSRSGAFILTDSPLPVGTRVELHFVIAGDDLTQVTIAGEVVRTTQPHTAPDERGMGIQFDNPSPEVVAAIDSIVRSELKSL